MLYIICHCCTLLYQGQSFQNYVLRLGGASLAQDVYSCVDEVSAHLAMHSNWIPPIIPSVPSCPNLVFDPAAFTERSQGWLCIDVETI